MINVNHIDIVLIPANQGQLLAALQSLGRIKSGAGKLIRIDLPNGIAVDLYIATPETWATLLLIRTGSKEHNIYLCSRARQKGMVLHADGRGLYWVDTDNRVSEGNSEEGIFKALGLPYKKPEERN